MRQITVFGRSQKPLRFRRLRPVKSQRTDVVAKRNRNGSWYRNRGDSRPAHVDQAIGRYPRQRIKLRGAIWAVGDAGILMHVLERGKEPHFIFCERPSKSTNIILTRKRLLRIMHANSVGARLRRILDRKAGVERRRAFVKGRASLPVIGSVFGRDHDRSGGGSASVRVF